MKKNKVVYKENTKKGKNPNKLIKLKGKTKIGLQYRAKADLEHLILDKDSILFCDKCQAYLGMLHSMRNAIFKKKDAVYLVTCKKCGKLNKRIKGELNTNLKKRWTENS